MNHILVLPVVPMTAKEFASTSVQTDVVSVSESDVQTVATATSEIETQTDELPVVNLTDESVERVAAAVLKKMKPKGIKAKLVWMSFLGVFFGLFVFLHSFLAILEPSTRVGRFFTELGMDFCVLIFGYANSASIEGAKAIFQWVRSKFNNNF